MHSQTMKHVLTVGLLVVFVAAMGIAPCAWGQNEGTRKTKNVIRPTYPDLARRMGISGVVKVEVTVAPNGQVKDARLIGGNPVLANAAMDAVKQLRYETRSEQTTETVEFHFNPSQ